MTHRHLAVAAIALVLLVVGAFAAIAALTGDPDAPSRPAAELAPSPRPAAPAPVSPARAPAVGAAAGKPVVGELEPSSGPAAGGGQVVIHGSNLGGVAQVLFGSTAARIAAREEGRLTVDVPSGSPGAATLVLTNSDGSYAVAPAAYTYR
jgi:IPT/TIG domain-containing protein